MDAWSTHTDVVIDRVVCEVWPLTMASVEIGFLFDHPVAHQGNDPIPFGLIDRQKHSRFQEDKRLVRLLGCFVNLLRVGRSWGRRGSANSNLIF